MILQQQPYREVARQYYNLQVSMMYIVQIKTFLKCLYESTTMEIIKMATSEDLQELIDKRVYSKI